MIGLSLMGIGGLFLLYITYKNYLDNSSSNKSNNSLKQPDQKEKKIKIELSMNSSTKFMPEKNVKERFKDVIGIDEFRAELEEIVDYLKNPKKYQQAGASYPKGVLLTGPPGTGKTLIARAIAGEANCRFFYASGSQFDGMYRGSGKDNIKSLFKAAKKGGPAIIFIDELDSLAGKREKGGSRNSINQLLAELDGF